ncbi:phosphoribosyltransferase [Pseudomonas sp. p1(2021b)]|uniref:phosphoribosyltransferase n=1 Tax=Pseudomonas sp. p1(2021b) TaxID=2874628 RepID=UPI001CCE18B7|nr:phosphoribosyltransferase [Pseudomonas sp. p1(2021b)]UBM27444.1 phosphoribosyltransferase [Pseudomonas sp. p1(2021b)]
MTQSLALQTTYANRAEAGRRLLEPLSEYANRPDAIVLALPRGGVPVAYEVATALGLRLDLLVVRKLGAPSNPEYAIGAIASGGIKVLNDDVLRAYPVDRARFEAIVARETQELARREKRYRGNRPPLQVKGQVVILVDDGLATGASMRVAVRAVRAQAPSRIVIAVPVSPPETLEALRPEVEEIICPLVPEQMISVGYWYLDFSQTPDEGVMELMHRASLRACSSGGVEARSDD